MKHTFSITYNFSDMIAASQLHILQRWKLRGAVKHILVITAICFAIQLFNSPDYSALSIFGMLVASLLFSSAAMGLLLMYLWWCIPRAARKHFAQMELKGQTALFCFDGHKISIKDPTSQIELEWSRWRKWAENANIILLYRTDQLCHYVPKPQVAAEMLDAIKANLEAAGIRKT